MEVYTLDNLYRRERVIDRFESLIWTERYSAWGDFQLVINSTPENRGLLATGTKLAINESYRVMVVETFEDKTDSDGKTLLTVTGRSLEKVLDDRLARGVFGNLTDTPKWVLTGLPAAIARKIYHDICVLGILDPGDVMPLITEGNVIYPDDTIGEPTDEITYEIEPITVYQALRNLCDVYDLGFRIARHPSTSQLYFDVYAGSDRTTSQDDLYSVIFSPDLENLKDTTELTSIALAKNVAYVLSPVGYEIVYPLDVDPEVEGFERQALIVKADDITDEDPLVASARMIQRGNEELARNRSFSAFDGEINQNSQYKYFRDYNLGDLVEMRNSDGVTNNMRVTEQIFVSDAEGERSYPALSINKFITPGSWLAWDFNQVWEELGLEEYWANQP